MRKTNEPWCFPNPPPRLPAWDRTDRWCFPDTPPRVPRMDPDEPWCFPDDLPRRGKRGRKTRGEDTARLALARACG
jgi:hypothetical protein